MQEIRSSLSMMIANILDIYLFNLIIDGINDSRRLLFTIFIFRLRSFNLKLS